MGYNTQSYKKFLATAVTAAVAVSAVVAVPQTGDAASKTKFSDMKEGTYFYNPVMQLVERNVISGFPDGTFRANDSVTRGQAAKIIALSLDLDVENVKNPGFKDVKPTDWYYGPVAALANAGIINGISKDTFDPAGTLSRAEMAKIIVKAYNLKEEPLTKTPFTDVKEGVWYTNYIQPLINNQITTGKTETTFAPNEAVTRGQLATFVVRSEAAIEKDEIISITDTSVELSSGTYTLTDEMKKWLNPSNAVVLKGAKLTYQAEGNNLVKVTSLEITVSGQSSSNRLVFDGNDATFDGSVKVSGDYISLNNLIVNKDLEIGEAVKNSFYTEELTVKGKTFISETNTVKSASFKAAADTPVIVFVNANMQSVEVTKQGVKIESKGTTTVQEFTVSSNIILVAEDGVTIPKVTVRAGATQVTIDAPVDNLAIETPDSLTVNGKGNIKNVTIESSKEVKLETEGRIDKVETKSKDTKLSVGSNTSIGDIVVPEGSNVEDIVDNYDQVKDNIGAPTAPPPSSGGGGFTPPSQTPVEKVVTNFSKALEAVGFAFVTDKDGNPVGVTEVKGPLITVVADEADITGELEFFSNLSSLGVTHLAVGEKPKEYFRIVAEGATDGDLLNRAGARAAILAEISKGNEFKLTFRIPYDDNKYVDIHYTVSATITDAEAAVQAVEDAANAEDNTIEAALDARENELVGKATKAVSIVQNEELKAELESKLTTAKQKLEEFLVKIDTAVDAVNAAENVESMRSVLEEQAELLELSLVNYNQLDIEIKTILATAVLFEVEDSSSKGLTMLEIIEFIKTLPEPEALEAEIIERLKTPVNENNIETEQGTSVPGVTADNIDGKVTLTVDPFDNGFIDTIQNVGVGGREDRIYHDVRVKKPEGATSVKVNDGNKESLDSYRFTYKEGDGVAGVMTYYPVGIVTDDGNIAFDTDGSWTRTYVWYGTDGEILRVDFLEVERKIKKQKVEVENITTDKGTSVPGVTAKIEEGKVTLTVDPSVDGFSTTVQNVGAGGNKDRIYHDVRVKKPEGATAVKVNDGEKTDLESYGFKYRENGIIAGVMTYYPVGIVKDGRNIAYDIDGSWTRTYIWYDAQGNILRVDFLEVVRKTKVEEVSTTLTDGDSFVIVDGVMRFI